MDEFGRLLHGSDAFYKFVSFIALRLSSEHWHVGTAHETKWGTGDHVRKKKTIPPGYRDFLQVLKRTRLAGIVSTNYDIAVEKLLGPLSSGRLGGFNNGTAGEELSGRHSVSSRWSYGPVTITGTIPLLKLHGSLNWAVSRDGELIKYIDCRPSRGRRYDVLVLPPARSRVHDQLAATWQQAHEVLSKADAWVVCGYSIPAYDNAVRDLLKAASSRVSRVCVCDINPDPVRQRLSAIFEDVELTITINDAPGISRDFKAEGARKLLRTLTSA